MPISRRRLLALLPAALLTGCGVQLRGTKSGNLPYKTMLIALPETADVRIWLERYINSAGSTEIVDDPKLAEATFQQIADRRGRQPFSERRYDTTGHKDQFAHRDTFSRHG